MCVCVFAFERRGGGGGNGGFHDREKEKIVCSVFNLTGVRCGEGNINVTYIPDQSGNHPPEPRMHIRQYFPVDNCRS